MVNKVTRMIKILLYQFSSNKRYLDDYMKRIRRLDVLTDSEWNHVKELAQKEQGIYNSGWNKLQFTGTPSVQE